MPRPLRIAAAPHPLALVRAALGLTQAQVAGLLGVSRPFVSQVEAGRCPLPLSTAPLLRWLRQALPPDSFEVPAAQRQAPPLRADERAALEARAAAVAWELRNLARALAAGQARAARAHDWLRAARVLRDALPADAPRPQRTWLEAVTAEAEAALDGAGSPARHRLLCARRAGLWAEAAALAADLATE